MAQTKVPLESAAVFTAEGYGAALIKRLLQTLPRYRELAETDGNLLQHLLWCSSGTARLLVERNQIKPWQLLSHFPGSLAMSSKSALLRNLRCLSICESKSSGAALNSFFPRAYDLQNPRELHTFILDFAVTKAEAILRRNESEGACETAVQLLNRFAPVLERDVGRGSPGSSTGMAWLPQNDGGTFCPTTREWSIITGTMENFKDMPAEDALLPASIGGCTANGWLETLKDQEHRQEKISGEYGYWILKEPAANCGKGVQVYAELVPLLLAAQRGGWDFVVQKYIERPLLVGPSRTKCDVRLWVLATSWNPAVIWAWPEPYLRLAGRPFSWALDDVADPFIHLTNRCVNKNLIQDGPFINSKKKRKTEDEEHIWMLSKFLEWGEANWQESSFKERWTSYSWHRMLDIVRDCFRACRDDVGIHPRGCFELFGFDFLLSEDLEPWLLEANASPDLCEDAGPSLRALTETALTEMFQLIEGVQNGAVSLPTTSSNWESFKGLQSQGDNRYEYDRPLPGSGKWHLILREESSCSAKELHIRRTLKKNRRPPPPGNVVPSRHIEVMSALFGTHLPPALLLGSLRRIPVKGERRRTTPFNLEGRHSISDTPQVSDFEGCDSLKDAKRHSLPATPQSAVFEKGGTLQDPGLALLEQVRGASCLKGDKQIESLQVQSSGTLEEATQMGQEVSGGFNTSKQHSYAEGCKSGSRRRTQSEGAIRHQQDRNVLANVCSLDGMRRAYSVAYETNMLLKNTGKDAHSDKRTAPSEANPREITDSSNDKSLTKHPWQKGGKNEARTSPFSPGKAPKSGSAETGTGHGHCLEDDSIAVPSEWFSDCGSQIARPIGISNTEKHNRSKPFGVQKSDDLAYRRLQRQQCDDIQQKKQKLQPKQHQKQQHRSQAQRKQHEKEQKEAGHLQAQQVRRIVQRVAVCEVPLHKQHEKHLTPEQQQEADKMEMIFKERDALGDGRMPQEELARIILRLNPNFSESDMERLSAFLDLDEAGRVDYRIFIKWLMADAGGFGIN